MHLGERHGRQRRRQGEHVDAGEHPGHGAAGLVGGVLGAVHVDADVLGGAGDDPGDDGVEAVDVLGDQLAHRRGAFGDERAAVQEAAELEVTDDVDGDDRAAECGETVDGGSEPCGHRRTDRDVGRPRRGHADAWRPGHRWRPARDERVPAAALRSPRRRRPASTTVAANTDGQSRLRTAGTTPTLLIRPTVGFNPTIPFSAAGTRPEPAVSVPRANGTRPSATATAEPELDPPGTSVGSRTFGGVPYGERVPTRPVANWSRLVLPTTIAPAARSRATTSASTSGTYAAPGHAAVVGTPATSMLSLTTNGTP